MGAGTRSDHGLPEDTGRTKARADPRIVSSLMPRLRRQADRAAWQADLLAVPHHLRDMLRGRPGLIESKTRRGFADDTQSTDRFPADPWPAGPNPRAAGSLVNDPIRGGRLQCHAAVAGQLQHAASFDSGGKGRTRNPFLSLERVALLGSEDPARQRSTVEPGCRVAGGAEEDLFRERSQAGGRAQAPA